MIVTDLTKGDAYGSSDSWGTPYDDALTAAPGKIQKLTFYVEADRHALRGYSVQYEGQQSPVLHGSNSGQATDIDLSAKYVIGIDVGVYTNKPGVVDPNDVFSFAGDGRAWIRDVRIRLSNGADIQLGTGPTPPSDNYRVEPIGIPNNTELAAFFGRADDWVDQIGMYFRPRQPSVAPGAAVGPSEEDVNPFIGCKIGTLFWGNRPRNINAFAAGTSVSTFTPGGTGTSSMTGHSRFFHTEGMNQGSLSFAGGYGVSGVASVTAAVDAYVGQSSARSGRDVEVSYNVFFSSGFEAIVIAELSMSQFIAALAANARRSLLAALEAYVGLRAAVRANSSQGLLSAVGDGSGTSPIETALDRWTTAVDQFFKSYGDGFVSAVHWGARGSAKFTMSSGSSATSWAYGGAAQFSYAGPAVAVSLKAAYDGSSKSDNADVTVSVKGFYSGLAIKSEIDAWVKTFADLAFDKLANINPSTTAPDLSHPPSGGLTVPPFVTPKEQPETADTLKKLDEDSGAPLSAADATKAAAFKKAKASDKTVTEEQFEKDAKKPVDQKPLKDLVSKADPMETIEESSGTEAGGAHAAAPHARGAISFAALEADAPASPAREDVIPLGLLICSWSDLFPWLSRTIDNDVANMPGAKRIVQWRLMIQDGLQLSNLYYIADAVGLDFEGPVTLRQLGDEFASMGSRLQSRKSGNDPGDMMKQAYNQLSPSARIIYRTWCQVGFLRQAELGLGVVYRQSSTDSWMTTASYRSYDAIGLIQGGRCDFDPLQQPSPYPLELFAEAVKASPIISATGEIRVFCEAGYLGFFTQIHMIPRDTAADSSTQFSHHNWLSFSRSPSANFPAGTPAPWDPDWNPAFGPTFSSIVFSPDAARQCLLVQAGDVVVSLFPIPVGAANNLSWKGALTAGVSLASSTGLQDSLSSVSDRLGQGAPQLTFGGGASDFSTWGSTTGLSDMDAKDHYLGIIPQDQMMSLFEAAKSLG